MLDYASLAYAHLSENKLRWPDISSSKGVTATMLDERRKHIKENETKWFGGLPDETQAKFREATGLELRRTSRLVSNT